MNNYLVTKGEFESTLLRKLEPENLRGFLTHAYGPHQSSAISIASSCLTKPETYVVLVLDSNSINNEKILEERSNIEYLLNLASPENHYKLILIKPSILSILFKDRMVFDELTGHLGETMYEIAQYDPERILHEVGYSKKNYLSLLDKLNNEDIKKLQQLPEVKEIFEAFKHEPTVKS
jgi:hypothetical protein